MNFMPGKGTLHEVGQAKEKYTLVSDFLPTIVERDLL